MTNEIPPELPPERRTQLVTILEREHNRRYAHLPLTPTRLPPCSSEPPRDLTWRKRLRNWEKPKEP